MRLDLPTLFAITVFVSLVIGILFLAFWNQARATRELLLWGVAHLCGGVASSLICLRGVVPDVLSIALANALMLLAYGLIWSGVRVFEGRRPNFAAASAGGAVWLAACLVPAFYASLEARIVLASSAAGLYCALAARECHRGRGERLPSRTAASVVMVAYAALYWVRVPLTVALPATSGPRIMDSPWVPILCFAAILFTVTLSFLFMALTKERLEFRQRIAAETDPLTGLANRRAFVNRAQAHLHGADEPVTVLVFDLDHFKAINDRYGHAVGDAVLVSFSHLSAALLPNRAILGRLGGEEFACILPGTDLAEARRLAETLRAGLARMTVPDFPDLAIRTSVGVAVRPADGPMGFDALMREADAALYCAKSRGRDRVEIAAGTIAGLAAA